MGSREPLASVSIPLPAGPLPSPADDIVPPLMNRPTTRSPLPGWMRVGQYIILGTDKVATIAYVCNGVLPGWTGRVMLGDGENRIGGDSLHSAQLAAEDAARAMVAEMAAALGGRVVWGPVCPFCSFEGADVGVDGQMQCAGCGALGVPADAADAEGVHP